MKEPAKDFNQFSENEITKNPHADDFLQQELEQQPNLLSSSADKNDNKQLSPWKKFLKAYRDLNKNHAQTKPKLAL